MWMKSSLFSQNRVNRHETAVICADRSRSTMYRAGRIDLSYNKMYCIDLGRTGTGFSAEPYLCSVSGAFCQERPCRPTSNLRGIRTRRIAVASSSDNSYTVFNGDDTAYLEGTRGPRGRELISDELKQVLGLALPGGFQINLCPVFTEFCCYKFDFIGRDQRGLV